MRFTHKHRHRHRHKHEAAAEVSFPGISHSLETKERKKDIKQTLDALYAHGAKNKEQVKRMFLSQFWAELRIQYKNGEQFDTAEAANVQSLLNMRWVKWLPECTLLPCVKYLLPYKNGAQFDAAEKANVQSSLNTEGLKKGLKWLSERPPLQCVKYLLLQISTSLKWWVLGAFVSSLMFTVLYAIVYKYTF